MQNLLTKVMVHSASFILCCAFVANAANAQDWKPTRNVDILVASGAGGAADRQGRQCVVYEESGLRLIVRAIE